MELADQVLARLEAAAPLAGKVIDGAVDPDNLPFPPPFVVVYVDTGLRSAERASSDQPTRADSRIIAHAVGEDAVQARFFAGLVVDQLLGWKPTIAGWASEAVAHHRSLPVETDKSTSPPTQYLANAFKLISRKA
jgi:hypothetical protein